MTFSQAVRTVVVENYFDLKGRASRSEFWWFILAYFLGSIVIGLTGIAILGMFYWLALLSPQVSVGFRRLQDTGRPGWYYVIPAIYGLIAQFMLPELTVEVDPATGMPLEMPDSGSILTGAAFGLVGLVIAVLFIWWLTRPSEAGPNVYGPNPDEVQS